MPDLEFERIELNAIPSGDMPVFHASQYETMRPFISDLKWGDAEFAPGEGCWCTLSIRKTDDTLVIIDSMDIDNNSVSCILPQQAVACVGDNFCQLKVWAEENGEDGCIACLNFILQVQPDPEAGGLTSESEIQNLENQIAEIVPEVIGNDYYNKTETDALLATKADTSDLPDMSLYYTKTQSDTLLNAKADKSDTYTKSQVDTALAAKANSADLATVATTGDYDDLINKPVIPAAQVQSDYAQADNTQVDYIKNKPDISGMIADALLAVMPVGSTGPSAVASFDTALAADLADCVTALAPSLTGYTAVNLTACGVNLFDKTNVADGYIDDTTGAVSGGAYYKHTDYLPVVSGQKIYILTEQTSAKWGAWYDKDKNYLSGITNYTQTEVTVPNNACYIRLTCKTDDTGNLDTFAVNYPSTSTYHAYTGNAYVIALGDTYYGGTLDVTTGVLTVEYDSSLQPITPYDVQLSPTAVRAIVGVNNVYSDTGDTTVQYKDTIQHYIDTRV